MAHKFVGEAERAILDSIASQHNAIFARGPANEAHIAHGLFVLAGAKRARRRNVTQIASVGQFHLKGLFSDEWMGKIDRVGDRIHVGRIDSDELISLPHLHLSANPQIRARTALLADACLENHLHKGTGTAV